MTSKEKAEEIFYKMSYNSSDEDHHCSHYVAKNCSLIAVDEIINGYEFDILYIEHKRIMDNINFWDEVKQEIEKL